MQNSYLLYHDIFTYTKPAIESGNAREGNPIWAPLNDNYLFELSYAVQLGVLVLGNYLSKKVDNSGSLACILNGALSFAEVLTIANNDKVFPKKI